MTVDQDVHIWDPPLSVPARMVVHRRREMRNLSVQTTDPGLLKAGAVYAFVDMNPDAALLVAGVYIVVDAYYVLPEKVMAAVQPLSLPVREKVQATPMSPSRQSPAKQ